MKGAADKNHDGFVSHDELYSFLLETSVNWSHRPVLQASAGAATLLKGAAFQPATRSTPAVESKEAATSASVCIKTERLTSELNERISRIPGIHVSDACMDGLIARPANGGGFDLFQATGIAINNEPFPQDKLLARISAEPEVQELLNLASDQRFNLDLRLKPDDKSVYTPGTPLSFEVRTEQSAYLLLLNIDITGAVTVVYPFHMEIAKREANAYNSVGAGGQVQAPYGIEYMKLFAFREKPAGLEKWNASGDEKEITVEPGSAKLRELMRMIRAGKPGADTRLRLVTAPGIRN
jgi:hypothetical protein